ncbi:hypothetical protein PQQ19_003947 [Citrobacter freundii]|uniref:hypothetical protein n=1 Tax=Citrobacter portucalensis TaxID=1639133 RepID=UPI0025C74370|nr:hypothetical protein [Citrobacter portucalensis]EKW8511414.1 hypothetical protein [Citrobacter freundii]MDT7480554.1 hypothetical protein [Citrobacter portucalensis]
MAKTELNRLNRAFRKETRHWMGHPDGFANKKQWKNWCRENAVILHAARNVEPLPNDEVINDQLDADSAVIEEMSNW